MIYKTEDLTMHGQITLQPVDDFGLSRFLQPPRPTWNFRHPKTLKVFIISNAAVPFR